MLTQFCPPKIEFNQTRRNLAAVAVANQIHPNLASVAADNQTHPNLASVAADNQTRRNLAAVAVAVAATDRQTHYNLANLATSSSPAPPGVDMELYLGIHGRLMAGMIRFDLNKLREALTVLDYLEHRGIPVNPTTFASLISACTRSRNLPLGRQIHTHIRINNLHRNEFLLTKLVEMYAVCASPDDAKALFNHLAPQTPYPWNALLKGSLTGARRWGYGPLTVFLAMREAGVEANEYTYLCLLKSFAGSPALVQGAKAHVLLIKKGFAGTPVMLMTSLIDMYFKCRKPRMAMKVFVEMPERDVVSWGAVIAGFAHNGLPEEALVCLRRMGGEGI